MQIFFYQPTEEWLVITDAFLAPSGLSLVCDVAGRFATRDEAEAFIERGGAA